MQLALDKAEGVLTKYGADNHSLELLRQVNNYTCDCIPSGSCLFESIAGWS